MNLTGGKTERRDYAWTALMGAVVIQAVKDTMSNDLVESLEALLWLCSDDIPLYLEAIGMSIDDPLKLLSNIRKSKYKLSGYDKRHENLWRPYERRIVETI